MIVAPANPLGGGEGGVGQNGINSPVGLSQNAAFTVFEEIYNGPSVAARFLENEEGKGAAFVRQDLPFVFSGVLGGSVRSLNAQKLSEYFEKRMRLDPVKGVSSPLRRLSYAHPDKDVALSVVKRIHHLSDEIIRERILEETFQRIAYLNEALGRTNNPEHKHVLAKLLMEQERKKMMASLDQPYAASIVEPAFVFEKTYWPDRALVLIIFGCVGLLIGYIVALFVQHKKRLGSLEIGE